jgi:hypothetical protein
LPPGTRSASRSSARRLIQRDTRQSSISSTPAAAQPFDLGPGGFEVPFRRGLARASRRGARKTIERGLLGDIRDLDDRRAVDSPAIRDLAL